MIFKKLKIFDPYKNILKRVPKKAKKMKKTFFKKKYEEEMISSWFLMTLKIKKLKEKLIQRKWKWKWLKVWKKFKILSLEKYKCPKNWKNL